MVRLVTVPLIDHSCAFCDERAVASIYILEELPPEAGTDGDYWTRYRGFERMYVCAEHERRCRRYRFWVREKGDPSQDEDLGDGCYRTPVGWEYRVVGRYDTMDWVRLDDDEISDPS